MDNDVRTMLERSHQVRGRQRVVDDERHSGVVRYVGDSIEIEGQQIGVADRFRVDKLRPGRYRLAHPFWRWLAEVDLDSHLRQRVREEVVGPPIKACRRNDLITR